MFDVFENYLSGYGIFNYDELDLIRSVSKCKRLGKKDYLVQEGNICRYNTFVCKGCLRSYRIEKDATEYILNFAIERCWINEQFSFNTNVPTLMIIDALEDSEVLQWSNENFSMLQASIPAFNLFYRKHLEKVLDETQRRIISILSNNAQDKYEDFINTFPELHNRIPLHMIASYLGMSRETLSRVRSSIHIAANYHNREKIQKRVFRQIC